MSQPDQSVCVQHILQTIINISQKKMKEYLIRAIYCVMLGHDIPFAYVHALTMTQDPKIYNKRTGIQVCLFMRITKNLYLKYRLLSRILVFARKS